MSDFEKENFTNNLSGFIQKNRRTILTGFIVIVTLAVGGLVFLGVHNMLNNKALSQIETFSRRYNTLRSGINEDSKENEVSALLEEITQFAETQKGYASARAYAISADIFSVKKNWTEAAKYWDNAAQSAKGSYLEPVALYNEAVALEEQNNLPGAIELFAKASSFHDFPAAPRAQFNIGRLRESLNKDSAVAAYEDLLSKWPGEDLWSSLAQSRIISLTITKN